MRYKNLICVVFLTSACLPSLWPQSPSFWSRVDYPYAEPDVVGIGDFNGDGIDDFVTVAAGGIFVAFGNRDGSFRNGPTTGATSPGLTLSVADFDGDGKLDVLYNDVASTFIAYGNGDGTFTPTSPLFSTPGVYGHTYAVTSGDLNKDGKPDIAIGTNKGVFVLLNQGNRTFSSPVGYLLGQAFAVAIGDATHAGL